jgi:hypothetical protein
MNDKQIAALFMAQLLPAMQANPDLTGVKLARNFQPRQQGANSSPYVYFVKLGDKRYGHTARRDKYDPAAQALKHTELQAYLSTYQFSAWVPQDPRDVTGLTESDILNIVSGIMQSDAIISAFQAAEVGVSRVTDVRNPYIVDEHDQFEAVPSFDVVLSHKRQNVSAIPAAETVEFNVRRV